MNLETVQRARFDDGLASLDSDRIYWRWLVGVALPFPFATSAIHLPEALKSVSGEPSSVT